MPSVVVLGAGPGLGLAAARAFATAGYDVGLVARSADRLRAAAADLSGVDPAGAGSSGAPSSAEPAGTGRRVAWRAADVRDPAAVGDAVRGLADELGGLTVLHHNVSRWRDGGVSATSPEALADDLALGVVSLLSAVRSVADVLAAAGGAVLVTGGGAADSPPAAALTLGPQKAAVRALVHAMADDLAPRGVRVRTLTVHGTISPGTAFDPDRIAAALVDLADGAAQPVEVRFDG